MLEKIEQDFISYIRDLRISKGTKIAIGVSGGMDSLCLAKLLSIHFNQEYTFVALIVNHGLREIAEKEALDTQQILSSMNVNSQILTWEGKKPSTGIEEKARKKRYELLLDFCKRNTIPYLFIAHHANDQLETFLSRIAHVSGLDGLACIQEKTVRNNIVLVRPFLRFSKAEIHSLAVKYKITWHEDEMNYDDKYERVKWRNFSPFLIDRGITEHKIHKVTKRLLSAKDALEHYKNEFISSNVILSPLGYIIVSEKSYLKLPFFVKVKFLQWAIDVVGQSKKILSLDALENKALSLKGTIGECCICVSRGKIYILKEFDKLKKGGEIKPFVWQKYDRFWIYSKEEGFFLFGTKNEKYKKLPSVVKKVIPVFVNKKGLEFIPEINYNSYENKIRIEFNHYRESIDETNEAF